MTTGTGTPTCCQVRPLLWPDGSLACPAHTTEANRALLADYDRRAPGIGLRRTGGRMFWPYGPNIDVAARGRLLDWAEPRGLREAHPQHVCLDWLLQGRCNIACCYGQPIGPWFDHVTGWNRGGKPAVLVCQPYSNSGVAELQQGSTVVAVDVQHDGGWYGHGTIMITITAAESGDGR